MRRFKSLLIVVMSVAAAALAIVVAPGTLREAFVAAAAQEHQHDHEADIKAPNAAAMQMHQRMMADMKAAEVEYDALVRKMNESSGDAKVKAMADLLSRLVQDRKTMRDHMMSMENMMSKRPMMKDMTVPEKKTKPGK